MKSIIVRVAENARDSPFVSRARFTRAGFRARGLDLRRAPTAHRCDLDGAAPGNARAPAHLATSRRCARRHPRAARVPGAATRNTHIWPAVMAGGECVVLPSLAT